jgi:hypothetical protein
MNYAYMYCMYVCMYLIPAISKLQYIHNAVCVAVENLDTGMTRV